MTRLVATGDSILPSFPQTLEGEGYCPNLRQRMVPRYRRASTFGTAAYALDGSADFAYVRWLGDRKGIEKQTTTWDKTVIDRTSDLKNWVDLLKEVVNNKKIRKLFAFANNHYAGHGPGTVKLFMDLWHKKS